MKLLYTKRSPYARKVIILALEKKIKLDLVAEDLTKKSTHLIEANPLAKVPSLILDGGIALFDSPVICEYIDSLNETPILIPKEKNERLKVKQWEALADGLMDVTIALYMEKIRHPKDFNVEFVRNQQETIYRTLFFLEHNLNQLKHFNLGSIAVAAAIGYLNFRLPALGPSENFPQLHAWFAEFSKRPSMKETVPTAT